MKKTLESKSHKRLIPPSQEDVDIALKWMADETHLSQHMKSFGKRSWGSAMYSRIARGLRHAYRSGLIVRK